MDFYELLAEEELNPRGEQRADLRNAITATTIASVFGSKNTSMFDFMPKFDQGQDKEEVTQDEFDAKAMLWESVINKSKGKK